MTFIKAKGAFSIWVALGIVVVLAMGALLFYKWVPPQYPPSTNTTATTSVQTATDSTAPAPVEDHYTITQADNGGTFSYPVTSRFSVELDATRFSQTLACAPDGIVGPISNIPAVPPPLFVVRFEAVAPGTCVLSDGTFSVTIIVEPIEKAPVGPGY